MTYNEFIQQIIETRGQWNIPKDQYFERHHILPICMGGVGETKRNSFKKYSTHPNCIWLYPQEHYEAHKLLAKENPTNNGLQLAWFSFTRKSINKEAAFISAEDYAELKIKFAKTMSKKVATEKYNKQPVICLETQQTFQSIQAALRWLGKDGFSSSNISKCCKDITKTAWGYHWQYWDENFDLSNYENLNLTKVQDRKKVLCIETNTIYANKCIAAKEVSKLIEKPIYAGCIGECCTKKRYTAGGYHWEYVY